jgi:hypothetical protein
VISNIFPHFVLCLYQSSTQLRIIFLLPPTSLALSPSLPLLLSFSHLNTSSFFFFYVSDLINGANPYFNLLLFHQISFDSIIIPNTPLPFYNPNTPPTPSYLSSQFQCNHTTFNTFNKNKSNTFFHYHHHLRHLKLQLHLVLLYIK